MLPINPAQIQQEEQTMNAPKAATPKPAPAKAVAPVADVASTPIITTTLGGDASLVEKELGVIVSSPVARGVIYGTYLVALILFGGVHVWFNAMGWSNPSWFAGVDALFQYVGAPTVALAFANRPKSR